MLARKELRSVKRVSRLHHVRYCSKGRVSLVGDEQERALRWIEGVIHTRRSKSIGIAGADIIKVVRAVGVRDRFAQILTGKPYDHAGQRGAIRSRYLPANRGG